MLVDDESSPVPSVGGVEWVYQMHQPKRGEPKPAKAAKAKVKARQTPKTSTFSRPIEAGLRRDREINQTFKDICSSAHTYNAEYQLPPVDHPIHYFEDYLHRNIAYKGSRDHLIGLRLLLNTTTRVHGIIFPDDCQETRVAPESWAEIGRGERTATNKGYLPFDVYGSEFP